ncbi:ectonucleotide pyrophosphatase/phosphodiesterase [Pedobacter sp. SYP-B3415]|uniref:alkaline phosphatase family protein n=1 Tax=Pedobacter sp. SYP-B3415 TaxID=2496641 RepID=UPI00101C02D3|nr:ectonucleotide pyrophosphatase/phosphodiesterase [Pedobacter sp. SYP-B3415]
MKNYVLAGLMFMHLAVFAQHKTGISVPQRFNSRQAMVRPYVILISADGFRWDLAEKFQASNLLALRKNGVHAKYLQSAYPSLTFPNHYSIVTGMYPSRHGIVDNNFFDPKLNRFYASNDTAAVRDASFYGGVPLWTLAEQQQMLAASYFWVGSEAPVGGMFQTYYYPFTTAGSIAQRIAGVKAWLQLPPPQRPHLLTFYFREVDHAAHYYGADSPETGAAVHFVDQAVGDLVRTVDSLKLDVNYIFVSDHGMTSVLTDRSLGLPSAVDTAQFIVPPGEALVHLYAKDPKNVQPVYSKLKAEARHYKVYLAGELPRRWHYAKQDDTYNRIGDIVLVPDHPYIFNLSGKMVTPGKHGYDPELRDMRGVFYAWGPAFKTKKRIAGFENIHIYPLIARILGLTISQPVDGRIEVLKSILR